MEKYVATLFAKDSVTGHPARVAEAFGDTKSAAKDQLILAAFACDPNAHSDPAVSVAKLVG